MEIVKTMPIESENCGGGSMNMRYGERGILFRLVVASCIGWMTMSAYAQMAAKSHAALMPSKMEAESETHLNPWASSGGPVRVALVTLDRGEIAQGVVDLATAELSTEPAVEVLERQAIDAVLAEQGWSLSGLVSAADAVRAGQVLGADVLVVIQHLSAGQVPSAVAFDSGSGIRLMDEELQALELETQAKQLAGIGRQAVGKWRNPDAAIRTFSVLAVQNVDLPEDLGHLPGAVGYLLERQMIRSPAVAILERERLDVLNAERMLAGGQGEDGLRASVHLLEMDISRGAAEGHLRVYARLSGIGGDLQGEFATTGPADASALVDAIQAELLRRLEAAPPPAARAREAEAQRYRQEANIQFHQQQLPMAIRAAEAAHALDPDHGEILQELTLYHFRQANGLGDQEDGVRRMLQQWHWLDLLWRRYGDAAVDREVMAFLGMRCPSVDQNIRRGWSPRADQTVYRELLGILRQEYARYLGLEHVQASTGSDVRRVIDTFEPREAILRIAMASSNRDTYLDYLAEYTRAWMEDVRNRPASFKDFRLSETMRIMREMGVQGDRDDHSWFDRDIPYFEGLRSLFMEMEGHSVPYMSWYGQLGVLYCDKKTERINSADVLEQVRSIEREVLARISTHAEGEENLRNLLYLLLLDLYDQVNDLDERQLLYHGLFEFMLAQNTLVPAVGHAATVPYTGFRRDGIIRNERPLSTNHFPRLLKNALRYLETIHSRDSCDVHPTVNWIEREIRTTTEAEKTLREALGVSGSGRPWTRAVRSMDLKGEAPEQTRIDQIHEENGDLYILASALESTRNPSIALYKTDLQGQAIRRIFSLAFDKHSSVPKRLGPICRYRNSTYIPTYGAGVLVVSDEGSYHWINSVMGLASDWVHSVAVMDETVFVASGEEGKDAYLSQHNMRTGEWTLLAASRRREKTGPLDQLPPYVIRSLQADPARGRVVFTVDYEDLFLNRNVFRHGPTDVAEMGCWSYHPGEARFSQLLQLERSLIWFRQHRDHLLLAPWSRLPYRKGVYAPWKGMVFLDCKTDRSGIVYYSDLHSAGPDLSPTEASLYGPGKLQEPPYMLDREGIWFARPAFGRHLLTGELEFFPDAFPDKEQSKRIDHLVASVDESAIIAATDTQVWVFHRDGSAVMRDEDWKALISPLPVLKSEAGNMKSEGM